jgi:hypothetical protein
MKLLGLYEYRIGKSIPKYELSNGIYCSHWGLTDLYEECEKGLRELLDSGNDFITTWCGSKKEIISAQYSRYDGHVHVEVCQSIDDLWDAEDLIYDALSSIGREDVELPDEIIDSIRDTAIDCGIDDSDTECVTLPTDATYDDVMKAVEWAENQTDKRLTSQYEELKTIVQEHVNYMEENS